MKKIVDIIGSFVVTCVLFAIPICLALMIANDKVEEMGIISGVMILAVINEFALVATLIYSKAIDEDIK